MNKDMIPGTATQLVTTAQVGGTGASASGASAQPGDGAFAAALAGAETVLDTAAPTAGTATSAPAAANAASTGTTDAAGSAGTTDATQGGAASSSSTGSAAGSDASTNASTDGTTAADDSTGGDAVGAATDIGSGEVTQAVLAASVAATLASVGVIETVTASDTTTPVSAPSAPVSGQVDAIEAAIRVATKTTTADAVVPAQQTTQAVLANAQSATQSTQLSTATSSDVARSVDTGAVVAAATTASGTTQEAEVQVSGDGAARATGVQASKTDISTGPNPAVPAGTHTGVRQAAQQAAAVTTSGTTQADVVTSGPTEQSVVPTAASPVSTSSMQSAGVSNASAATPVVSLNVTSQLAAAVVSGETSAVASNPAIAATPVAVNVPAATSASDVASAAPVQQVAGASVQPVVQQASTTIASAAVTEVQAEDVVASEAPVVAATTSVRETQTTSTTEAATSAQDTGSATGVRITTGASQADTGPHQDTAQSSGDEGTQVVSEAPKQTRSAERGADMRAAHASNARAATTSDVPQGSDAIPVAQPQTSMLQAQNAAASAVVAEPVVQQGPAVAETVEASTQDVQVDAPAPTTGAPVEITRSTPQSRVDSLTSNVMTQERIDHIADQLAMRLKLSSAAGGSEVHLQLRPRELGEVTVQMNVRQGVVAATVVVDRVETGKLMQSNLDDLRKSLESQGLNIQQFSVDVRGGEAGNPFERMNMNGGRSNSGNRGTARGGERIDMVGGLNPGLTGDRMVNPDDMHDGNVSVLV